MRYITALLACLVVSLGAKAPAQDALPSWNDGQAKQAILDFVDRTTTQGSPDFVPPAQRIATFDNDGCLWAEQPAYFQLIFAIDRVKQMAADHPEWEGQEPFKSAIAGDMEGLMATGKEGLAKILAASHTGMTTDEFADSVRQWLETARHPTTGKTYTQMVYKPMLELLDHLRDNGYKTFIVSGGGIDFLRVFAEEVYGIPPEQVVGTSVAVKYEVRDGVPVLIKQPQGLFVDDKEGKPAGIHQHIGRRPVFAAGNSDGDFQMLEYTTSPQSADDGPRLAMLVHHTDADREWAYDRDSHIGQLVRGLDEAEERGWVVVDMAQDWATIFP